MSTYERDAAGRRIIPSHVKQDVLDLVAAGANRSEVATKFGITPKMIWKWERTAKKVQQAADTTQQAVVSVTPEAKDLKIRELEQRIDRLELREAILKKAISILNPPS